MTKNSSCFSSAMWLAVVILSEPAGAGEWKDPFSRIAAPVGISRSARDVFHSQCAFAAAGQFGNGLRDDFLNSSISEATFSRRAYSVSTNFPNASQSPHHSVGISSALFARAV